MEIRKTVLVPHPAEPMFDLIEAAEHYPAFVAGCRAALRRWLVACSGPVATELQYVVIVDNRSSCWHA